MTSRPARSTPGNPRRSACWPASSCRGPASRWTSASCTSRSRRPTPGAPTRRPAPRCEIGCGVRGVVRDVLQRLPGQLLAALVDARVGGAARRADRQRPRRRLPVQGHRRPDHRGRRPDLQRRRRTGPSRRSSSSSRSASTRSRTAAGSGSTSPPTPRSPCTAPAGTRRCPRPGRANVAVGIPTFNRPADCVNALAALTSDPLVDEVIGAVIVSGSGHQEGCRPPGLRRGRRPAGQPAVDPRPAQPRRFRRLQPGDVRGAEKHRL